MRTTVAILSKNGESALPSVIEVLKSGWVEQPLNFTVVSPQKAASHKSPNVLCKQGLDSATVFGCAYMKDARKTMTS